MPLYVDNELPPGISMLLRAFSCYIRQFRISPSLAFREETLVITALIWWLFYSTFGIYLIIGEHFSSVIALCYILGAIHVIYSTIAWLMMIEIIKITNFLCFIEISIWCVSILREMPCWVCSDVRRRMSIRASHYSLSMPHYGAALRSIRTQAKWVMGM